MERRGGIAAIPKKNCPLTIDHFEKNSFNGTKTHIAFQTLLERIYVLIIDCLWRRL